MAGRRRRSARGLWALLSGDRTGMAAFGATTFEGVAGGAVFAAGD